MTFRPCLLLAAFALFAAPTRAEDLPWDGARQLVLVTISDWDSPQGTLRSWNRVNGRWQPAIAATPVAIGRNGAAWGIGLHPPQAGPRKREGDGRSPAGVFALGTAFGYAASARTALPYAAMDADDWCIDVDGSPLYNRIVDARDVGAAAVAGSTEPMRLDLHADGDLRYQLGFVIEHNPGAERGAGSCIFAHLWKAPDSATAGCTAMAEPAMRDLLAWLDADRHPVFVLLPQAQYTRLHARWSLPEIASDVRHDAPPDHGSADTPGASPQP
jgi:L,D-peptidoglycan transpeptidase YkuD (ErfK/YbiS/YcfS/YnhG family)